MDCEKSTQTNKSHFILHNDKWKCFFFIKVFPITILFSLLRMSRLKVDQKLIEFFVKLNRQKILHITCMQICCNTAWHNHFLKPPPVGMFVHSILKFSFVQANLAQHWTQCLKKRPIIEPKNILFHGI